jgi:phosphoglycerol transferase
MNEEDLTDLRPMNPKKFLMFVCQIFISWVFLFLIICIPAMGIWANFNFGSPTFEQLLFTITFEPKGLLSTEKEIIASFKKHCIFIPASAGAIILFLIQILKKFKEKMKLLSKAHFIFLKTKFIISLLGSIVGICIFLHQFSFFGYATSFFGFDYFGQNYVPPQIMNEKSKRKNLVVIYLESMETGYRSKEQFGKNLLASLDALPMNKLSFASFRQAPGTGWTIAAHVSTQCGIPLKVVLQGKDVNTQGEVLKSFLPHAKCLGDILREQGYKNVYLQSATLDFAGTREFWLQHGYDEAYGAEYLQQLGYRAEGWGVTDDKTLIEAKKILERLQSQNILYNFTISLVDTHGPEGIASDECRARGYSTLEGVVECTSQLVAEFIQYIELKNYLENTNVVILGDHRLLPSRLTEVLSKSERKLFNSFISRGHFTKNREDILHFDFLPTILTFAGIDLPV